MAGSVIIYKAVRYGNISNPACAGKCLFEADAQRAEGRTEIAGLRTKPVCHVQHGNRLCRRGQASNTTEGVTIENIFYFTIDDNADGVLNATW